MALPSAWSARGGLAECSYPVHSSLHEASSQPTTLRGSGYSCRLYRKYSSCRNAANDRNSNAALRPHYETAQGGQNHAAPRPRSCRNLHKGSMAASRSMALRAAVDAASTAAADLSPRAREEAAVGLDRLQNGNSVHTDRGSNGAAVPQASPGGGTTPAVHAEAAVAPEDFQLAAGELSTIDRGTACAPGDVFRCTACTRPECQVRGHSLACKRHGACMGHACNHVCMHLMCSGYHRTALHLTFCAIQQWCELSCRARQGASRCSGATRLAGTCARS